jgi:D-3-phosphoglycerate dehydrogenase
MARILANDGIHPAGKAMLEEAGHEVVTDKIAQEDLPAQLPSFDCIVVRSATKVRGPLIDACPDIKVIARAGVGLDNIDVTYAESKGIRVVNTPAASSRSVAELVFGHFLNVARSLHVTNRAMPTTGATEFSKLKKGASKGIELLNKSVGIVGFGRIGQEVAKLALGFGMKVLAVDPFVSETTLNLDIAGQSLEVPIKTIELEELLAQSDFISLHVPFSGGKPIIGQEELGLLKSTAVIVNASRGGVIDEEALMQAVDNGKILGSGLDVFVNEPTPDGDLLQCAGISLSPHIGASTSQAQENIGTELARKIIALLG